ncbi:MAG: cation:proton antiporter [Bacilli bacterium]|jgi:Kef-type K+ transport system membrane component KefB|nr:cation:proton antiporter [Bacilli bacterium]MCH4229017.1 cation:proton antiporter [Bacilli bacterium]
MYFSTAIKPTIFVGTNWNLSQYYSQFGEVPSVLIGLSIMLFTGFLVTRLTKLLKLPNVTAYIIAGVILGPWVLGAIDTSVITHMSFISDVALSFIAFGVGRYFKISTIKETGPGVFLITLLESVLAGVLVTLVIGFAFPSKGWNFALLLGAIATATAPASTMMTIRQYGAKGNFVNVLLEVVSLDDAVCLICYTLAITVINADSGSSSAMDILMPVIWNLAFIGLGFLFGFIHSRLMSPKRSPDNRLILTLAMLLILDGACAIVGVSPLMSCMVFGATYVNVKKDQEIYSQMDIFAPPIMCLFFVMSGMNMDFASFAEVGLIGVIYFFVRILGKYGGAYLGCLATREEKKTRDYLGMALIPQAGVAIGLAVLGQRMLPTEIGNEFYAIIICSSILYELIGPGLAKLALIKSGSISREALQNPPLVKEIATPHPTEHIQGEDVPIIKDNSNGKKGEIRP